MSINIISKTCKNCGAPLAGYLCLYCDTNYAPPKELGYRVPTPRPELVPHGIFEISLGSSKYKVLGKLAQGSHSQVLLAQTAKATTQRVVLKVSDRLEALEREWATLKHLQGRCSFLDRLLPRPLKLGRVRGRSVLITSWRPGFVHTLGQAKAKYGKSFPGEAAVWIWNRVLEQLTSLSNLGYAHNNLSLDHLLVHPRDHGITFCGWSKAALGGGGDLLSSGLCIAKLLGSKGPRSLRELAKSAGHFQSAHRLKQELKKVARAEFGPPRFVPFAL